MINFLSILFAVLSTIFAAFGLVVLKMIAGKAGIISIKFFSGALLFLIGALLMVLALKYDMLSVVYPIASLVYVWVIILSKFLLKESINRTKVMAVILILLGVFLIAY